MRTIERITRESTAVATPERPATASTGQAIGIKNMLQELSEAMKACVQVQMEKKSDFRPTYNILKHKSTSFPVHEE